MAEFGFKGGEALQAKLQELAAKLGRADQVRVGFLEGSTEADGTPTPLVAAIQEFGAPKAGIPPRPFFRTMIAKDGPGWGKAMGDLMKAEGYDASTVLGLMGEGIAGQLQQSIIDTTEPALSPITLMLRKMKAENPDLVVGGKIVAEAAERVARGESSGGASTKPLVESGDMLNAVDYEVKTP